MESSEKPTAPAASQSPRTRICAVSNMTSETENKRIAPPRTLPPLSGEDRARAVEKIYIYPSEVAHGEHVAQSTFTATAEMVDSRKKEEEDKDYIYNFSGHEHKRIQTYTKLRRRRGSYKTNAVQRRMKDFAQDFNEHGFPFGHRSTLSELKYWIEALELAHDRITVDQYVKRLCMHGYFYLEGNGSFTFLTDLPGQVTLPVIQKQRKRLRLMARDRRIKHGSY